MYTFFLYALLALVLLSVAMSLLGTYIVTRRQVFIAGGITHTCFGGLGLGYWLGFPPSAGAVAFALIGAWGAKRLSRTTRSDSAIATIWAVGMALGILFVFLAEGNAPELNTFLFGNVLTVAPLDLWLLLGFTLLLCLVFLFFRRVIVAVSFDEAFARTRALPAGAVDLVMTLLVAVGIVLGIRLIGIMLLMSLVSLPQITAERFTRSYGAMTLLSAGVSLLGCVGGLVAAWYLAVPASACIVLLLALFYVTARFLPRYSIYRK